MFDAEHLFKLGLFNQVVPIWQVFFYILSLVPFLLLNRVRMCLFITYLFTFYLGFMVQWGDYIASAGSLPPFVLYALSGMVLSVVIAVAIFSEESLRIRVRLKRTSAMFEKLDNER